MNSLDSVTCGVALEFLQELQATGVGWTIANERIEEACGILDFYADAEQYKSLPHEIEESNVARTEWGDVQTPSGLARRVCENLVASGIRPTSLFEPTCGKGNFLLASIAFFPHLKEIFALEIYGPYIWQVKLRVLTYFLENPARSRPIIHLLHKDFFEGEWEREVVPDPDGDLLILGNPPWVTNAQMGVLEAANLPEKSNRNGLKGLDAITGKGTFDIAESITTRLLARFSGYKGHIALLLKNATGQKLVQAQAKRQFPIGNIRLYRIDHRKEFQVAAAAGLFMAQLAQKPSLQCEWRSLYNAEEKGPVFGWVKDVFVANCQAYLEIERLNSSGESGWRSGIKHDCSAVFELQMGANGLHNKSGESISIEPDLLYPLLKSSQLKGGIIQTTSRRMLVTQQLIGQETHSLAARYPETYAYLTAHATRLEARKSRIYRTSPTFAIFGVGAYSFLPYKVAISGMYKQGRFSLLLPVVDRPVMLDDTCYFLGFERLDFAAFTWQLLQHELSLKTLNAFVFLGAKRPYTKEVLNRIDLAGIAATYTPEALSDLFSYLCQEVQIKTSIDAWNEFKTYLSTAL